MKYDQDMVDDYTLALLYLASHERNKGAGVRAWEAFDRETMNRLHQKGFITSPRGKAGSMNMTDSGFKKAVDLFEKLFVKK